MKTPDEWLCSSGGALAHDLFLDLAQAVLAEEDLVADEEGRRAEGAALEGGTGCWP